MAKEDTTNTRRWGYKNPHHLVELKEPPPSLVQLRGLLARPENLDIMRFAAEEGTDFETALGAIAAKLDIVLDGKYDVENLCELLCKGILLRAGYHNRMHTIDSRLQPAELQEREGAVSIELPERVWQPEKFEAGLITPEGTRNPDITKTYNHSQFMQENNCTMCDDRELCINERKCLAKEGKGKQGGLLQ